MHAQNAAIPCHCHGSKILWTYHSHLDTIIVITLSFIRGEQETEQVSNQDAFQYRQQCSQGVKVDCFATQTTRLRSECAVSE